ncbi:MAG: 2-oxo acid dehydrogenase subunit E2 [Nitriliruptoraceae bacterium]|nr:2-oxo acid dehydrogenase subunit E2 [Nitriliruptoraceae bacterium]
MATLTVRMPALSATMEDAELITWLVAVGDEVRSGQPMAEVATDKVDMELESPYDGVVAELLVEPGARVDLGVPVATVTGDEDELLGDLGLDGDDAQEDGDDDAGGDVDGPSADPSLGPAAAAASARTGIVRAHPPARRRARQLGIDLHDVTPTGSRGHVTHADLDRYLKEQSATSDSDRAAGADAKSPTQRSEAAGTAPAAGSSPSRPPRAAPAARGPGGRDRRRAIRLATARSTTRSAAIPQFTLHRRIDVSLARERREGRSWTTELARALAAALWRHPACNAVWDDEAEDVRPLEQVRIGIAVATDDGLVVVGVDDPDAVDPAEADNRVREAIARARSGRLTPDDVSGISSTISNLGGFGIDHFDALLLPPQATILSVGRMNDTPIVIDGRVRVRPMMSLGLTVDHRVADGADGAQLLETFASRLET